MIGTRQAVIGTLMLFACDALPEESRNLVVGERDTTREAVTFDVQAEVRERLEQLEVDVASVEAELLIWEVRQVDVRDAPSDLAIVWATFEMDGSDRWILGQLFRHRSGSTVDWQWFRVADSGWLEFRSFDARPTLADLSNFLRFWDFESEGQNGTLLGAEISAERWPELFGEPVNVAYPPDTPRPQDLPTGN